MDRNMGKSRSEYWNIVHILSELIKGSKFENNTYFVGGCVRDEYMGKCPKDYDIVVSLPNGGVELAEYITKKTNCYKFGSNPVIFPNYGTAKFCITTNEQISNINFEAVETRKEQYHNDSKNSEIIFGTVKEDAFRRDLTINALYMNISTGEYLDPTEAALKDISNRWIRTTSHPDFIFSSDPLRMLRVIRFVVSLDFEWNVGAISLPDSIKRNLNKIESVSKERIRDEINKILLCNNPSRGFYIMRETGLLKKIFPDLFALNGLELGNSYHEDAFENTLTVLNKVQPVLVNRLSALFHNIGKYSTRTFDDSGYVHFTDHLSVSIQLAKKIMIDLKYPSNIIKKVTKVIKFHTKTKSWGDDLHVDDISYKILKLQSLAKNNIDILLDLIDAINLTQVGKYYMPNQVTKIRAKLKEFEKEGINCKDIHLPVRGDDIMKHLNICSGEFVGEILNHLKEMYLKHPAKFKEREKCLRVAKEYYLKFGQHKALIHYYISNCTKDEDGTYKNFGIHLKTAPLFGASPDEIITVTFKISDDQVRDKRKGVDYWGWYSTKEKYNEGFGMMIYPSYIQLQVCFPYGIEEHEKFGDGKAYRIEILEEIEFK
jgi:tRNA nucleotidyltransferase/poly(A) polymerase